LFAWPISVRGDNFIVPAQTAPGSMFVVNVQVDSNGSNTTKVTFSPSEVQFAGAVMPTPEVQLTADAVVEIRPAKGSLGKFDLKFLPLSRISSTTLTLTDGTKNLISTIAFVSGETKKEYHMHFLVGALVLLIIGGFAWRFQKKSPVLMSTRSLFMNFEELQKARQEFSPNIKPQENHSLKDSSEIQDKSVGSSDQNADQRNTQLEPASSQSISGPPPVESPTDKQEIFVKLTDSMGRSHTGTGAEITIGRRKGSIILLTGAEISRNHALIKRENDGFTLVPLSSSNITEVNGHKITNSTTIKAGDTLSLGGTVFKMENLK